MPTKSEKLHLSIFDPGTTVPPGSQWKSQLSASANMRSDPDLTGEIWRQERQS
jgi:hypothetical protein